MSRSALFLDRDGIINEEIGYLHRFEDVRFVPGIGSVIQTANALGLFTCIVTNQAGIGRGMYSEDQFHSLMASMRAALLAMGATIDAVYYCPFHPEHGIGHYRRQSDCRKSAPGMLLQAAREHDLDLDTSVMVGDRCSDIKAGSAAGLRQLFLLRGTEKEGCPGLRYTTLTSLSELVPLLGLAYS